MHNACLVTGFTRHAKSAGINHDFHPPGKSVLIQGKDLQTGLRCNADADFIANFQSLHSCEVFAMHEQRAQLTQTGPLCRCQCLYQGNTMSGVEPGLIADGVMAQDTQGAVALKQFHAGQGEPSRPAISY